MKHQYQIKWSEEDQEYVACVVGAPNISALGATPNEALAELDIVLQGYDEIQKETGIDYVSNTIHANLPKLAKVLKLSVLSKDIGRPQSTIASRLKHGTAWELEEFQKFQSALHNYGLTLTE